jgi:hypothetical protein
MKEQWRQQMQQKLADYQQPAPEVSWDLLDKTLAANKPKAKVVPMWTRRLAAAVVAAVIVVSAGYLMLRQQDEDTLAIVSQHTPEVAQTRELTQTKETIQPLAASNAQPQRLLAQAASQSTTTATTEIVETTQEGSLPVQSVQQKEKEKEKTEDSSSTKDRSVASQSPVHSPVHSATVIYPSDFHRSTSSTDGSRLMAKAYLSNSMTGGANAMSLSTAISNSENNCPDINDPKDNSNPTYNPSTPIVQEKEERVSHRQPIRFGLTLCYRLSDQWSIESGLVYSRLTSDHTYLLAGTPYAQGEQQLSYIGIPLKVNYQLWNSRHVGLYVTAGGMMEKMVKGSLQMTENGKEQKTDVSIKALQFSVNGAVGMEYRLSNLMSIYAEPGVDYYFNNHSNVPTYYQEKPFSFNLNIGLRFCIK